ncbi:hypothetical protein BS47DRAFT_1374118 [Hydnum rufescens UP504]|uniref:Uncharacterized protein n=1 Tax=Hydnum rufescens UP504 TaxID=1448309 RepID=A0A9P6AJE8_9AGAM|nr:hypothetical protein BS47DRAFT_1374118 [Hydnum rufescens UP504]
MPTLAQSPQPPRQQTQAQQPSPMNNGHSAQHPPPPGHDMVSAEQYRYALTNFRIAHEQVERQRQQLEEQERQVALLRQRIAVLEGGDDQGMAKTNQRQGGSSVDDFSIKNAASKLERLINRWAAEVVRTAPSALKEIYDACREDTGGLEILNPTSALVQNILRHAFSETVSEGIINCLIVTNSSETNRDPTVASVWRRQTFSAAVEAFTPEMSKHILSEHIPGLSTLLLGGTRNGFALPESTNLRAGLQSILDAAYTFSRMLHASKTSSGGAGGAADAFYRAFVPELGSVLYPRQIELLKRCKRHEAGLVDRVGACVFPGLVKVARGTEGTTSETGQTVVRRAQVVCECALGLGEPVPETGAAANGVDV